MYSVAEMGSAPILQSWNSAKRQRPGFPGTPELTVTGGGIKEL